MKILSCNQMHLVLQVKSRKRLAKTVLVFVGLFAVCWLPSHVIYLYRSYHYSEVHEIQSLKQKKVHLLNLLNFLDCRSSFPAHFPSDRWTRPWLILWAVSSLVSWPSPIPALTLLHCTWQANPSRSSSTSTSVAAVIQSSNTPCRAPPITLAGWPRSAAHTTPWHRSASTAGGCIRRTVCKNTVYLCVYVCAWESRKRTFVLYMFYHD